MYLATLALSSSHQRARVVFHVSLCWQWRAWAQVGGGTPRRTPRVPAGSTPVAQPSSAAAPRPSARLYSTSHAQRKWPSAAPALHSVSPRRSPSPAEQRKRQQRQQCPEDSPRTRRGTRLSPPSMGPHEVALASPASRPTSFAAAMAKRSIRQPAGAVRLRPGQGGTSAFAPVAKSSSGSVQRTQDVQRPSVRPRARGSGDTSAKSERPRQRHTWHVPAQRGSTPLTLFSRDGVRFV